MRMGVRLRTINVATLVIVDGEVDLANVRALRGALVKALKAGPPVVVDFTDVTFADSTAVTALVGAYRQSSASGTSLQLVMPPSSRVPTLLDLTGVTAAIPLCDTLDVAIRSLTGERAPPTTTTDLGSKPADSLPADPAPAGPKIVIV